MRLLAAGLALAGSAWAGEVALPFRYVLQGSGPAYSEERGFGFEGGEGSKIWNTLGDYPEAVRQTAKEEKVALIDLHAMSAAFYEALGPAKSLVAFGANGRDATHHSAYGAYEFAKCVVAGSARRSWNW